MNPEAPRRDPLKMLVPVDYSDHSREVLKFALSLSHTLPGAVTVLHVWETGPQVPDHVKVQMPDGVTRRLSDLIREEGERTMEEFLKTTEAPASASRVSFGWAAAAIVHEAERGAFDLVVMGTQGLTGIGHFVLGSVAEKVVRTSPIPVITIPPLDAKATATFRKILVPVDFSPASRLALERALAFATSSHAIVHVLHVGEVPSHLQSDLSARSGVLKTSIEQRIREDAQAALSRFVEDVHPGSSAGVTTELRLGTPYRAILEACDQGEFDLVAMGTHGRTGLSHLFVGSVAEKVVRMCKRPVLTVRPPTA